MSKPPSAPAPPPPKKGAPRKAKSRRRYWLAAALAAVAAGVGSWFFTGQNREWRAARAALEVDDFPTARRSLERCREIWPRSHDVVFALARLERRGGGDVRKALILLEEAGRLGRPPEQLEFERMLLEAQAGGIGAAEPRLRAAIGRGGPDAPLACEARVKGWLQTRSIPEAHAACDDWVGRFPGDWRAHFWLGVVLQQEGYTALAAEEYGTAADANPGNFDTRLRLADALVNLSEFPRALPHLERCRDARPDDALVRFDLARSFHALGKDEEAEGLLQALVAENPKHGPALLLLARVRLGRDDPAGAAGYARRAVEIDPGNAVAAATLAEALRGVQSDEEAARWEEKARTLTEQNERLAALNRAVNYHPRDVAARYELGTLLIRLGRREEAVRCLRGGLAIDPNHQPTRDALAALSGPPGQPGARPAAPPADRPERKSSQ
jgi:tetratricopeptide (TPR) repeat protein